ncbi:MAG: FAD-dependent oxidoreductase [Gammaproteobacteria bacterium]|jgi:3-phenylpropionate/trans-cinnamate dioxygenase ferredoxin reductase component|nr:FAD-dependent oxidoreductase [Gammaproteobacteria bacterium]MBT4493697.1 FAD-dependent oxidoreductase [Gammaproteobacteria bacterium]MBT7370402.1 FAD-dependent oxidoreductase [Gammaproteobacteria bacterium]
MSGIVIIGAGQAAGQAAASLRQEGFEGTITILGDEDSAPYQRPPLSKQYLSGEVGVDRLLVRPEKFYVDKNIDLKTGTRVGSIAPSEKSVTTTGGDRFEYDKLLIATGSRPRILNITGSDLEGIHYLRTMGDVDGIRESMGSASRICIVGGGYIGLEVAAVARTSGLDVTVLEMEDRILQRVTTPEMSAYYHQLHAGRGVNIMTNTTVSGFQGNGSVSAVLCGDEIIEADLVIVGIGIIPNVELAETAGLKCENGIVVDDHCRSSDPDIYAAGDCTNHPNPLLNRRLRLESVPNAMEQARVASANMLGGDRVYAAIPWFWSDQYELKLQMVGFSSDGDSSVIRGDKSTNEFAVFYLNDGKVVAVDAVNSPREFMVCKQLYGKAVNAPDLANPEFELKSLLN